MRLLSYAAALAWVTGCAATETGNPVAMQRLALTAVSSAAQVQLEPGGNAEVLVEEAWIVLGDVRFIPGNDCDSGHDDAGRVDISGPTVVELLSDPAPLSFEVEDREYCRVRLPLERADEVPRSAPEALEDHAVVLIGSLADGTPFEVRSRDKREAEVRSRSEPFRLGGAEAGLLLAFDVGRWLEGLDLAGAEDDGDGRIVIDDDDNRDLLDQFEQNMREALELFRDLDEDGQLDDDERSNPLAVGG
ncbi:MAG: hypothetical protein OXU20_29600 [Myxococcales bacterium]|nr:hypothetical protein [Myxococcales bacterium]